MKQLKSDREIFDFVKTHLLKQNKQAGNESGCVYRARDGTKCAVGCLIPDWYYSEDLEGLPASSSEIRCILKQTLVFGPKTPLLLSSLQLCHDSYPIDEWSGRLKVIEEEFFNS